MSDTEMFLYLHVKVLGQANNNNFITRSALVNGGKSTLTLNNSLYDFFTLKVKATIQDLLFSDKHCVNYEYPPSHK